MYEEHTTIDGQLVLVEGEGAPLFRIRHPLTNQLVPCTFGPADAERAKAACTGRIEATGIMQSNSLGQPVGFVVERFDIIPPATDLPTLDDLGGVNITDGVDPSEFVRRLREGESEQKKGGG